MNTPSEYIVVREVAAAEYLREVGVPVHELACENILRAIQYGGFEDDPEEQRRLLNASVHAGRCTNPLFELELPEPTDFELVGVA